ncbi:uncharacterized protein LOC18440816 isoform X1 [Amborella trichopoda]|uniref:uncharacterized protein LOC18440816 isoform X1 n=1 Tax=Amborella trichopoda TaxID=13333 RepID=UPI0009C06740|nr:uncharacterized protein LOC18440816 isoform X1 [Amborella trichopoda]XP_020527083.1 uncharacterized protein LOC18440816 isoform X1 [Amborella trichopoda]XP_020527084.1 uncharacterized protein LOC18440816 isoform X1 [Amborella trichopoda]XP_020527085.1 uncharacterized protein LOC18440816 isoform X1 [Amborella trichopoda]XP_020527086.1 uncharacterized protein LOC18440816 isoform X1 [Amborella trichopoda]XP_020527087.1 uncharacterized protein LOC18440816 isoform X1 [Amborella trichopoda]|eukprot:XP_020527082.1 uncharacterized protein LOC18440816 isoform X1 [Amborella trichopoda]
MAVVPLSPLFSSRATYPTPGLDCSSDRRLSLQPCNFPNARLTDLIQMPKAESSDSKVKKANLYAKRKERVKLPNYVDDYGISYPFSSFLAHPLGMESILNTRALQCFELLDSNTYRCTLQKISLLKFEVTPILDLRVTTTTDDCVVELLSCKFEGSEAIERQSQRFSAFMRNHITWDTNCIEAFLDMDVKLNITLEVFMAPFTRLPITAVETPGNLLMQALVDKLVPLLIQQLLQDYHQWVLSQAQAELLNYKDEELSDVLGSDATK